MKFLESYILNKIAERYLNEIGQIFQITEESFKIQTDQINNVKDILKKSIEPKSKTVLLDFYGKSIIYIQYIENLDEFNEKLDTEQLIDDYKLFLKKFKNKFNRKLQNRRFGNFNVNTIKTSEILLNSPIRIKNLLKMAHIYLMAEFEAFNHDYFTKLLVYKPQLMIKPSKSMKKTFTLTFEQIIEYQSEEALFTGMIEKFISNIPSNIDLFGTKLLDLCFNIKVSTHFQKWENLRESYYRRNAIVHNKGRYSENYIKNMNLNFDLLNKEIDIDIDYLRDSYELLIKYIKFVHNLVKQLFLDLELESL